MFIRSNFVPTRFSMFLFSCVEDSDEDDDGARVDRKDVTDVLDDGRDDEEGSC
ncbi:hypothetical protein Hanom_Chr02g00157431 [Helianthus anomalus]